MITHLKTQEHQEISPSRQQLSINNVMYELSKKYSQEEITDQMR